MTRRTLGPDDFVPYVEGTPGAYMTFPCLRDVGHEGPCLPYNLKYPERRLLLDRSTCRRLLRIKDEDENQAVVDEVLGSIDPTTIEVVGGGIEPGQSDIIGEGKTFVCDQLLPINIPPSKAHTEDAQFCRDVNEIFEGGDSCDDAAS